MAFEVETGEFIRVGQLFVQLRVIFQYRQIHIRYQLQQSAVLRNFLLVHRRHSLRKVFPNIISRDGVRHDVMPPVNITWSVEKAVAAVWKNLRIVI